jgi:malate permease and related proteins
MLTVSFQTSLIAIFQIFCLGSVGYFLVRRGVMDDAGLKLLSFLSVNIVFPLFIFNQIVLHFDPVAVPFWWAFPLVNIGLTILGLTLTSLFILLAKGKIKDEFLAASALHNAGYLPILIAMALPLGEAAGQMYAAVIMSVIGFDLCLWSIAVWLLSRHKNPQMELKNMINPPLIAMAGAIVLVLSGMQNTIPDFIWKPVRIMGDVAMGMTMLIIGGNLAMTSFKNIQFKQVSGVVLIKLLIMPVIALSVILVFRPDPILSFVLMLQSCMPTSVTLSLIGRHYQAKNQDFLNQSIFITHLLCMVTLPIFLGLYGKLAR